MEINRPIEVQITDVMRQCSMEIDLVGVRTWRWRVRIATVLLRLVAKLVGVGQVNFSLQ